MSDLTSHMEAFVKAVIAEDVKWLIANPIESFNGIEERHDLYDPDGFTVAAFDWKDEDTFKLIAHGICKWNTKEKSGSDHRLTLEYNGSIVMTTKYVISETHIKQIDWLKREMDLMETTDEWRLINVEDWPTKLHRAVNVMREITGKVIVGPQLIDDWIEELVR